MKRLSAKRLLLSVALTLTASASVFAQTVRVESRDGDRYVGPVREVRVEKAEYVKQEGVLVEGPRRLLYTHSCSEDGKRCEYATYSAEGTPRGRLVNVYDDEGRMIEQSSYSEGDRLAAKETLRPDEREELVYNDDGTLRQRTVSVPRGDGNTWVRIYKGDGTLDKEYPVPGGIGYRAARRSPVVKRGDDMTVSAEGPRVKEFESAPVRPDGARPRARERRERDKHGNPLKVVQYVWDDAAGDYVPIKVFYFTITYYR